MRRFLNLGLLVCAITQASGAIQPIFIIDSPTTLPDAGLPTINATAFVNESTFVVNSFTVGIGLGSGNFLAPSTAASLPYETFNTLYFTNQFSGIMSGTAGFRFLTTQGHTRKPALWFVNEGSITGGGYVEVQAQNIINHGPLDTSGAGLVRLTGKDVDVTRSRLRTGQFFGTFSFSSAFNDDQRRRYLNDGGVYDSYWGVGSNGVFLGTGPAVRLNSFSLNQPSPFTPLHQNQYIFNRRLATNRVSLPKFTAFTGTNFFVQTNFAAFVYTNILGGTAAMVQVVFVRTNSADGQLSTEVRFSPDPFDSEVFDPSAPGPARAMVSIMRADYDPTLDLFITNTFSISDSMAIRTNLLLYTQMAPGAPTRRPNVYEFGLGEPFDWFGGVGGNSEFVNGLLDTGYLSNRVEMRYAGYRADVFTNIWGVLSNPFLSGASTVRPTNLAGRVEIIADRLNLDSTRIRGESTVLIRAKDLVGNKLASLVDAPLVGLDLVSKQPELVISNVAAHEVTRLSGAVCVWSGQWKNYQVDPATMTTNEINFHVLFVDHSFTNVVPVNIFEFRAKATNIVITDSLNLAPTTNAFGLTAFSDPVRGRNMRIDARSLDVRGGLSFPFGNSWAKTNMLNIVNFTNSGLVVVPGAAKYGTDRPEPYNAIVNSGTNTAASQLVRTRLFDNSGCFIANQSQVLIDAVTARIEGPPIVVTTNIIDFLTFTNIGNTNFLITGTNFFTNIFYSSFGAKVQSYSDLQIKAGSLTVSNSLLAAGGFGFSFFFPGRLVFTVTNRFEDAGPSAPNIWNCSGFEVRRRPTTGNLLGTWISATIPVNALTTYMWPAQDLGAVAAGFTNNLALGRLTLNTSTNNGRAVFKPASGRQALYVDYLELFNDATNFNRTVFVDPNMTIYFANANVPVEKLDGAVNGRFRWVPSFAGPLSTTNITYPSGNTYAFNIALISSLDIDSDNDGIPNALDPYPIDVPGEIIPPAVPRFVPAAGITAVVSPSLSLRVSEGSNPPGAVLSWTASPFGEYAIEFKNSLADANWEVLTHYVNGPSSAPVSVSDPMIGPARMRLYRLRVISSLDR